MADESRFERPPRRGRIDDSGGDTEGGKKLYYHLTLLAENNDGLPEPHQARRARVPRGLLLQAARRLGAARAAPRGHHRHDRVPRRRRVAVAARRRRRTARSQAAARFQDIFGRDNFFVELQDHGIPEQRQTSTRRCSRSRETLGAPLLATNDSHYTHRDDAEAHDALLCVQTGSTIDDPKRFKFDGDEFYLKTAAEMRDLFRELPEACDNTLWIAERADVEIEFGKPQLPAFPVPEGFDDDVDYLRELTIEGAESAGARTCSDDRSSASSTSSASSKTMGFSAYFLVVWDLVRYARRATASGSGPGRGARPAACVAYCLRIVDIDPIKYDLLFERFLNPGRKQMPDIDMDFDSRYRGEMIRYAAERYGRDHVAQIVTFSTIKARAAVRDAARVLGYPYAVGDKIAKVMPPLIMGRDTPLHACFEHDPKYEDGYKMAAELRELYDDRPRRQAGHRRRPRPRRPAPPGRHPRRRGGDHREPLTEYLPIQRKPEPGRTPRTRRSSRSTRCTASRTSAC